MWVFGNKLFLIVVLLFIVNETNGLVALTYTLFSEIMTTWNNVDKIIAQRKDPNQVIIDGIKKANNQLKVIGSQITDIQTKVNEIDKSVQRITAFTKFYDITLVIRERANEMDKFKKYKKINNITLRNFAEQSIGKGENKIDFLLKMLSNWFIGSDQMNIRLSSLIDMYSSWMKKFPELVCELNLTPQHFLYLLYDDFLTTNLRGYAVAQYSYLIMQIQTNESYCNERKILYDDIIERAEKTKKLVADAIQNASGTMWECDPKDHINGTTYDEFSRLLQGFVTYKDIVSDRCYGNCEDIVKPVRPKNCRGNYCKDIPTCNGMISDCHYSATTFTTCSPTDGSSRRYTKVTRFVDDYIVGHSNYLGGTDEPCKNEDTRRRFGSASCRPCMCICNGDNADKYISLHEVTSNAADNMVVTGVRFKKLNKIFHLQIQEGRLIRNRKIDPSTLRWVPLDDFKITNSDWNEYHVLTNEHRSIALTNISMDAEYVVTGLKLNRPIENGPISLAVRFTPFDDNDSDKLLNVFSTWRRNNIDNLKELTLNHPDIPIKTHASKRNLGENQFIKFTFSDMDKDAAQTTVPFIDVQDVTSNQPEPLSGLGFYFKGVDGYGGFIAPITLSYNYDKYLSSIEIENKPFECCEVGPNNITACYKD